MKHYGKKEVAFKHDGSNEIMGLTFQVTDVRKPLLAVGRLVEKGNQVVLAAGEGDSYILNVESQIRVPIKKRGPFVIEAQFVKKAGFTRHA